MSLLTLPEPDAAVLAGTGWNRPETSAKKWRTTFWFTLETTIQSNFKRSIPDSLRVR
jgi:hypothetical protein